MQIQYSFKKEDQSEADISIASFDEAIIPSTGKCKYCSKNNANQVSPINIKVSILYWSYYWNENGKDKLIDLTRKKIEKVYLDKFVCNNQTCKIRLSNDIRTSFTLKGIEVR